MTFGEAVNTCLKQKYATFQGRAARSEYWWFTLFSILAQIGAQIVFAVLASMGEAAALLGIVILAVVVLGLILPGISVLVRRLHDTDRSGWWFWIALVPLVGSIILLVFLVTKGTEGENTFGADPLA
ncbi:DUF805 domain-containing protein [Jannaschia marina]|uniref:DUF805 domain-containing protein n=1 Tax=Jannaschia marina TaxID=2741674 RepID=UPI0015CBF264|nr:DUF805 domain-containing protein [Jannaschia marina]